MKIREIKLNYVKLGYPYLGLSYLMDLAQEEVLKLSLPMPVVLPQGLAAITYFQW